MAGRRSTHEAQLDAAIGAKLAARRLEVGMSQAEAARAIGVTFQQVQKYEAGTNRIAASRLIMIAEALSVRPTYFLPESGE
jgi:Predicted transcriptional regulators